MQYCSIEDAKRIVNAKFENALSICDILKSRYSFMQGINFQMPTIVWRSMGVRRAGYCDYRENIIALNSDYLHSKDWKEFLDDTPLHELAHAISYQFFGERGHKRIWKSVCYQIGLKGNRCHDFATPEDINIIKRKRKTYLAHCDCMQHVITSVKYNRMQKGINYVCVKCRGKLTLD